MERINSAGGTAIALERTGNGPPLVLVHGGAAIDHRWWERGGVRPALAEHFTVHALDRRGRGQSGDAEEYALEREAEDVTAVVDAIDEPTHLLGHFIGALISLEVALRTGNLRTLILYEGNFRIGGHEVPFEEVLPEITGLIDAGENEQALVLLLQEIAFLEGDGHVSGHDGQAYDLSGPAAVTHEEIAAALTRALGRPIHYVRISDAEHRQRWTQQGMPVEEAEAWVDISRYFRTGACSEVTTAVQDLTVRAPRSLEAFCRDHAAELGAE